MIGGVSCAIVYSDVVMFQVFDAAERSGMNTKVCSGVDCDFNELFGNMGRPSFSSILGNSCDFGVLVTAFLLMKDILALEITVYVNRISLK
jgi:hypothetical protein